MKHLLLRAHSGQQHVRLFFQQPMRPKLVYTIDQAIELLKENCAERGGNPMFSMNVNLNLDPRIKGQKLKGIFDLPHSTGKVCPVVALTHDDDLALEAVSAGAAYAGDLEQQIMDNKIQWPTNFERLVATRDMENRVVAKQSRLARKLRRHKITPCVEERTLVANEDLVETVRKVSIGSIIYYRTDLHGNVAARIGRVASERNCIAENFNEVLRHLFHTRVPVYGTGPRGKKKNIGKYVLGVHLVASGTESLALDFASVDILVEKNQEEIPFCKKWRTRT